MLTKVQPGREKEGEKSLHPLLVSNQLKVMYSYLIHATKENKKGQIILMLIKTGKHPQLGVHCSEHYNFSLIQCLPVCSFNAALCFACQRRQPFIPI